MSKMSLVLVEKGLKGVICSLNLLITARNILKFANEAGEEERVWL